MYRSSDLTESRKLFLEQFRSAYLINALYDAIIDADLSTAKYLLDFKNIDPNTLIPEYDAAPLHAAPGIGTEELALMSINLLLFYGADPNITTSDGTTPLMISCLWGRENIVKLLLRHGADPSLEDVDGKNSFQYALDSDNSSVYEILKEVYCNVSSRIINLGGNDQFNPLSSKFCDDDDNSHSSIFHENDAKEVFEFSDVNSEANVIEFYSLNAGFRTSDNECNSSLVKNNALDLNQGMINDKLDLQINSINKDEAQSENSFITLKSSSSQTSIVSYATDHLRQELKRNKIVHGPVTATTKRVYQKLLTKVVKGKVHNKIGEELINYPEILCSTFKENFLEAIYKWTALEKIMTKNFSDEKKLWRGGKEKQFFTYILLDPFKTDNLSERRGGMKDEDVWKTFVLSIFYIGKGKNSRPFSHLYEALKTMNKKTSSTKVKRIQNIWDNSAGVICLHVFHNVISAEAHSREAAMIDAIGPKNLTNIQSGEYYGVVKNWSIKQKMQLGVVLLYKALQIYLAEGERQIFARDLS